MPQPSEILSDRYQLAGRIAIGGMGEVWRARDTVLDRPVAVKLLRPEYASHAETLARFRAEARHAGALSHPGIARVYDYGEAGPDHGPFLVMELVDGPALTGLLEAGPLGQAMAMDIVAQSAAGLDAAHAAGLVHRDIKPGNLLIAADGQVKITDFGIAHAAGSAPVTRTGMLIGTPGYLAPERVSGASATPASDIYSLGVVAFECLAGRPPFTGTGIEVAVAHRDQPLPPLPPDLAVEVAGLVAAMTAKDPAGRPPSAGAAALRAGQLRDALAAGAVSAAAFGRPASGGSAYGGYRGSADRDGPDLAAAHDGWSHLGPSIGGPSIGGPSHGVPSHEALPEPGSSDFVSHGGPPEPAPADVASHGAPSQQRPSDLAFHGWPSQPGPSDGGADEAARQQTLTLAGASADPAATFGDGAGGGWSAVDPAGRRDRGWPARAVLAGVAAVAVVAGLIGWLLASALGASSAPSQAAALQRPRTSAIAHVTVSARALDGLPLDSVLRRLHDLRLHARVVRVPLAEQQPGTVISVDPHGRVRVGSVITVTVAAPQLGHGHGHANGNGHGNGQGHGGGGPGDGGGNGEGGGDGGG